MSNTEKLAEFERVMDSVFEWAEGTKVTVRHALKHLPIDVPFSELTTKNIEAIDQQMNERLKPKTAKLRRIYIRRFLRWINGDEEDHPAIPKHWIHHQNHGLKAKRRDQQLKLIRIPDDVFEQMLKVTESLRDRAILVLGRRAGLRAGEALALDIGDWNVQSDEKAIVHVPDKEGVKTGERNVPVGSRAIVTVEEWLSTRPDRENKNAPLFISSMGSALTYEGLKYVWHRMLRHLAIAGVAFPGGMTYHQLRHTRAFEWKENDEGNTEDMMSFFGWASLTMTTYYGKRSNADMIRKWEEARGIRRKTHILGTKGTIACPGCGKRLGSDFEFCPWCGTPTSDTGKEWKRERLDELRRIEDERKKAEQATRRVEEAAAASLGLAAKVDKLHRFISLKMMIEELERWPRSKEIDEKREKLLDEYSKLLGEVLSGVETDDINNPYHPNLEREKS